MNDRMSFFSGRQIKRQNEQREALEGLPSVGYSRPKKKEGFLAKADRFAVGAGNFALKVDNFLVKTGKKFNKKGRRKSDFPGW